MTQQQYHEATHQYLVRLRNMSVRYSLHDCVTTAHTRGRRGSSITCACNICCNCSITWQQQQQQE